MVPEEGSKTPTEAELKGFQAGHEYTRRYLTASNQIAYLERVNLFGDGVTLLNLSSASFFMILVNKYRPYLNERQELELDELNTRLKKLQSLADKVEA